MRFLYLTAMASAAIAAPVPKPPPLQVTPDEYTVKWNGANYVYTFHADGTLEAEPGGWKGFWEWRPRDRELLITESNNNWLIWTHYVFPLDKDGGGKCSYSAQSGDPDETPRSVTVTVKRR